MEADACHIDASDANFADFINSILDEDDDANTDGHAAGPLEGSPACDPPMGCAATRSMILSDVLQCTLLQRLLLQVRWR